MGGAISDAVDAHQQNTLSSSRLTLPPCRRPSCRYALGVILFLHLCRQYEGVPSFPYLTLVELHELDCDNLSRREAAGRMAGRDLDWPMEVASNISPEFRQLVEGLLHKDPGQRAQGPQVRQGG